MTNATFGASSSMTLDHVVRGVQTRALRIMVVGTAGIGKTTFAAAAPKPIFIPTEDRMGKISAARFPVTQNLDDVKACMKELLTKDHDFKSAVFDTVDGIETFIHQATCDLHGKQSMEDWDYQKGYNAHCLPVWNDFLFGLNKLSKRGMHIILLCHDGTQDFRDPSDETYQRYVPRVHKKAVGIVTDWCDDVFFATYRTAVITSEESFGNKRKRAVGTGERIMHTEARPAFIAKNSWDLPPEMPLEWKGLQSAIKKSIKAARAAEQPTHQPEPTEEAN